MIDYTDRPGSCPKAHRVTTPPPPGTCDDCDASGATDYGHTVLCAACAHGLDITERDAWDIADDFRGRPVSRDHTDRMSERRAMGLADS